MLILGVDPGSRHTGYGLIELCGSSWEVRLCGRFSVPPASPLAERLVRLTEEISALVARERPDLAALEKPFHGVNARSGLVLAEARGALLAALARSGLTVEQYAPAEVKSAVAGHGRADKVQVARMVRLQLGLATTPLSADASDALAVALCAAARLSWNRRVESSSRPK